MSTSCVGLLVYDISILHNDDPWVLLCRHTEKARLPTGSYGFPAGRIEYWESAKIAGIRELKEETGLITECRYMHELPVTRTSRLDMKNGPEDFIFMMYLVQQYEGNLKRCEKTIPEWVRVSKVGELYLVSNDVQDISMSFIDKNLMNILV